VERGSQGHVVTGAMRAAPPLALSINLSQSRVVENGVGFLWANRPTRLTLWRSIRSVRSRHCKRCETRKDYTLGVSAHPNLPRLRKASVKKNTSHSGQDHASKQRSTSTGCWRYQLFSHSTLAVSRQPCSPRRGARSSTLHDNRPRPSATRRLSFMRPLPSLL
jgi:hypothetical protein